MKILNTIKIVMLCIFLSKLTYGQDQANENYSEITAKELLKLINEKRDFLLIDNRIRKEYNEGHIPGAQLIPVDSYSFELKSPIGETIQNIRKSQKLYLNFILIDKHTGEQYISEKVLSSFLKLLPDDKNKLIIIYDRRPT